MDVDKIIENINEGRYKAECGFVFSLWNDPELYLDYMDLNEGKDKTLKNEDAIFFYNLGKSMYKQGFRNFDAITVDTFLTTKKTAKEKFDKLGGYAEVKQIRDLVDSSNVEADFDIICKKNMLTEIFTKNVEMFSDLSRFENATSEQVFNAFDLLLNGVAVANNTDAKIEELTITDKYLDDCDKGMARGLDYGSICSLLNYLTLGIPTGDLTMLAGASGTGKSSFIFESVALSLNGNGIKIAIISNEMTIDVYQSLLTVHILTRDLNYYGLTRKKLKQGGFDAEQKQKLKEAQKIAKEKYSGIIFIKMFENETSKVLKYIRKLANQNVKAIVFDTFKADDTGSAGEAMWVELLKNSRRIFNMASKYDIAVITTYQLGISTSSNVRYLDYSTLSNSKQIVEVYSEVMLMRPLWRNEYSGERYDCKPYNLHKDATGKYIKDIIQLDPDKKYIVLFISKTRNDENEQQILYEFNGRFNKWREIGYCTIRSDVKG